MMIWNRMLTVGVIVLALVAVTYASDWTGSGADALWSTANNWTPGVPTSVDAASFNIAGDSVLIDGTVAASCSALYLGWDQSPVYLNMTGGSLSIGADAAVGHAGYGVMNLSGGTVNVTGSVKLGGYPLAGCGGELHISNGDMIIGANMLLGGVSGASGIVTMSGGSVIVGGWLSLAEVAGDSSGTLNLNGGQLQVNAAMALKQGGHIDIAGGTLLVANVYNAGTGATIQELFDNGYISAYGGDPSASLVIDTEVNPGFITVTAVPEPMTLTLLGLGLIGLAKTKR